MVANSNSHAKNPTDQRFTTASGHIITATQSDATNETYVSRGLLLDASGDITFVTSEGDVIAMTNLAVGVVHPIRVLRVNDTGTSIADADIFLVY